MTQPALTLRALRTKENKEKASVSQSQRFGAARRGAKTNEVATERGQLLSRRCGATVRLPPQRTDDSVWRWASEQRRGDTLSACLLQTGTGKRRASPATGPPCTTQQGESPRKRTLNRLARSTTAKKHTSVAQAPGGRYATLRTALPNTPQPCKGGRAAASRRNARGTPTSARRSLGTLSVASPGQAALAGQTAGARDSPLSTSSTALGGYVTCGPHFITKWALR